MQSDGTSARVFGGCLHATYMVFAWNLRDICEYFPGKGTRMILLRVDLVFCMRVIVNTWRSTKAFCLLDFARE
jgi:hypothetical protein